MSRVVALGSLLGLCASLYAVYVEAEMGAAAALGTEYSAACDGLDLRWLGLGVQKSSCSKVLSSEYAHALSMALPTLAPRGSALDLSNAVLGALFYAAALFAEPLGAALGLRALARKALLAASLGSLCFSVFLAYILKVVLREFCVVCVTMYVANILVFGGAAALMLPRRRPAAAAAASARAKSE